MIVERDQLKRDESAREKQRKEAMRWLGKKRRSIEFVSVATRRKKSHINFWLPK